MINSAIRLFVCLGNPGKQLKNTYHNIGSGLAEYHLEQQPYSTVKSIQKQFSYFTCSQNNIWISPYEGDSPAVFMNNWGSTLKNISKLIPEKPHELYFIADCLNKPIGSWQNIKHTKDKPAGHRSHNGMRDIQKHSYAYKFMSEYNIIWLGIGFPEYVAHLSSQDQTRRNAISKYVLSKIPENNITTINKSYTEILDKLCP